MQKLSPSHTSPVQMVYSKWFNVHVPAAVEADAVLHIYWYNKPGQSKI